MKKVILLMMVVSVIILLSCQEKPVDTIVNKITNMTNDNTTIKIGWISDLSGRFGSIEAARIAVKEINASGGVNGKEIELIVEDGECDGKSATIAALKLINVDKVKFILGGHCSPESLAIAPMAEANKVIMLAGSTVSPYLTNAGDYIFRTSPGSTKQSELIANFFREHNIKKIAILYEQTDYARPLAEDLKNIVEHDSGEVLVNESYAPGMPDFKMALTRIQESGPQAIFISPQSPESALIIMKQLRELGTSAQLFGNYIFGNQSIIDSDPTLFEGIILYQYKFDETKKETSDFIEKYKKIYNVNNLPFGVFTAIAYDGVYILVDGLKKCGENVECVKEHLYSVKDYDGVSTKISLDNHGDGVIEFIAKVIKNGKIEDYEEDFRIYSQ